MSIVNRYRQFKFIVKEYICLKLIDYVALEINKCYFNSFYNKKLSLVEKQAIGFQHIKSYINKKIIDIQVHQTHKYLKDKNLKEMSYFYKHELDKMS